MKKNREKAVNNKEAGLLEKRAKGAKRINEDGG